ncbi:ribosomal protein S5 domain 2-type protein [Phlebopus sp. FC_14]|nr:ribosomal protein S5 domain 2-type protein [Phlebopus sp. FC_14]
MVPIRWPHSLAASAVLSSHGSRFIAYASPLPLPDLVPDFLAHAKSLPALRRATHLMYAYRTPTASGSHDGGERGAGERLHRLLHLRQENNVLVLVARWYGGVKLGPQRWKCISQVAKEALDNLHPHRDDCMLPWQLSCLELTFSSALYHENRMW